MPLFRYRAVAASGEVVEGEMEAHNRAAVVERLHGLGHLPIRADEVAGGRGLGWLRRPLFRGARVGRRAVVLITRELATLLGAGLPLDRSLDILIDLAEAGPLKGLLAQLRDAIRGGASLADALAAQGGAFPPYYTSLVRAGEAGGSVETVLRRLADFLERAERLRETVRSALVYPTVVLVMAGLSVVVLLTVVLPQFTPLFEDAGESLPLLTRVVVACGDAVGRYWWLMAALGLGLALVLRRALRRPAARDRLDRALLGLPLFGELIAKIEAARFSRTLATLIANGVPVLGALAIVKDTMSNSVTRRAIEELGARLKEGQGLAEPLARIAHFPKLGAQLIRVGEETGRLEEMLFKAAEIYDAEVERTIARLMALLVPGLTVLLGLIVALIIAAILMAILRVYSLPF